VLFVDEVEKGFAGSQSSTFSDSGVTARVIGTFLTWMQECTQPVFTIATSNNIQYLPPELIQRFDEKFFINLPQMNERIDIFRIHLSRLNRKPGDFELEALAQASTDLSGREIEQALREAMYDAFTLKKELSTQIILGVLGKKTNLLTTMAEQLKYLLDWVGWDEEKKDGIRARFAHPVEGDNINRVQDEIAKLIADTEKNNPNKSDKV
jgi:ATPases of the AAA+ class